MSRILMHLEAQSEQRRLEQLLSMYKVCVQCIWQVKCCNDETLKPLLLVPVLHIDVASKQA